MKLTNLKVCGTQFPLGLTEEQLLFSFVVEGDSGKKIACRIEVASSPEKLAAGEADIFTSGEFFCDETNSVCCDASLFVCDTDYWWRIIGDGIVSESMSFGIGLRREDWTARWVTRKEVSEIAPIFLSQIRLKDKVCRARLYVSGLGYFEAYINGRRVGNDCFVPQVSDYGERPLNGCFETIPIGTRKSIYYLVYDVVKLLERECDLALLVGNGWYKNREKPNEGNFYYGEPKCIFELHVVYEQGTREIFSSNAESVRIGDSNLLRNTLYTGEIVDLTRPLRLKISHYAETELRSVREVRDEIGEFLFQKEPSDIAGEKFFPVKTEEKEDKTLFDFGQNHSGVLTVHLRGQKGCHVVFTYGENRSAEGKLDVYSSSWGGHIQRDELILSGGEDVYSSRFTVHGFRYCEMESSSPLEVLEIHSNFVYSGIKADGEFHCSEPLFEQIYKNYKYTHCSNLHGNVPTDCPHRERRGFLGDGHAAMGAAMYTFDMYLSYKKWIKDIRDTQSLTGYMPHTAPFSGGGGGPGFGSGCILIPYLFYQFYGDVSVLERGYIGMLNWIKYLNTRHDGDYIIVREEAGWCIGEWFNPTLINLDIPFANTYFFLLSLDRIIEISEILGEKREIPWLKALREKVREAFLTRYYDREDHSFCKDEKGAAFFGLDLNLLDERESRLCFERAIAHIENDLDYHLETGIFGTPLMFKTLSRYRRKDVLFKILSGRSYPGYGYMIERGATTLWEGFEERDGPSYLLRDGLPQTGYGVSHNHPMLGSVCEWMYSELAGLDISRLGATKEILLKPYIDGVLTYASAKKETVFGTAAIDWQRDKDSVKISIQVPFGCRARLRPENIKEVCLNGKHIENQDEILLGSGGHVILMRVKTMEVK